MFKSHPIARVRPLPILAACVLLSGFTPYSFGKMHSSDALPGTPRQVSDSVEPDKGVTRTVEEANGDLLMAQKKYQAAIREFEKAPQNSAVVCNKTGIAYHYMFNTEAARSHYERALKLDPKYGQAMNNLGTVLYTQKKYGQAEKLYKKALKFSPRDASIYSNLGILYFVRGDVNKGAAAYRQAFLLDPKIFERSSSTPVGDGMSSQQRAMMNYSLAKTYANVGMNDRALQYLRMALDEGFKDRRKWMEDREFADLRETPEFQRLVAEKR